MGYKLHPHFESVEEELTPPDLFLNDFDPSSPPMSGRKKFPNYLLISFDTEYESLHKIDKTGNWKDVSEDVAEEYLSNKELKDRGESLNRILCYSFSVSMIVSPLDSTWKAGKDPVRWSHDGIIYPSSWDIEDRLRLPEFIEAVLRLSKTKWGGKHLLPKDVYLVSHFTKADLPAFSEFKQDTEKTKLGLSTIRNTFVSLQDKYNCLINTSDGESPLRIQFRDTYLLAPTMKRKLSDIGDLMGMEKVKLHEDEKIEKHYKENMTEYFVKNPKKFVDYAILDAVIARKYSEKIIIQQYEFTDNWNIPVTLTGIGASTLEKMWDEDAGLPPPIEIVGKEVIREKIFNSRLRRYTHKVELKPIDPVWWNEDFAVDGYHGGRNEQFHFGVTDEGDWYDWDLESAYPTAMNLIGLPDWNNIQILTDKDEVLGLRPDDLGVVAIHFKFKPDVKYPCFPVRTDNGIIFPLEGYSKCGIPELKVAVELDLLESWSLVQCVYVPTNKDVRIFQPYLKHCVGERNKAKRSGDKFNDSFWKELVNSTYGKTAQGLRQRKVFDLKDEVTKPLPPNLFTNPFIAGFITSFVRGTLGEVLNSLPSHIKVFHVITDGFLTTADEKTLMSSSHGLLTSMFSDSAKLLGKPSAFGLKHRAKQLIGFRTRGSATLQYSNERVDGDEDSNFILQRGSIRLLDSYTKKQDNLEIVELFLNRYPGQEIASTSSMGVRDIWMGGNDLTDKMILKKLSMEFDFKRSPINPRDQGFTWETREYSHLTFETKPWKNVEEFQLLRTYIEDYNHPKSKVLKTLEDYRLLVDFVNSQTGSHRKSYLPRQNGSIGRLRQELCSAFYQYQAGIIKRRIRAQDYAVILTECGIPCSKKNVYDGKKRTFTKHNVPTNDETRGSLEKLRQTIPGLVVDDFLSINSGDVLLQYPSGQTD